MKIGTKSLLFGVHQIFIHPLFVLWAWVKLYGLPNWKELICIIIHDWGYWGLSDMNGEEGGKHPELGAKIAYKYLDTMPNILFPDPLLNYIDEHIYSYLCLVHSRFYAKRIHCEPSKLCWADKLGTALMPTGLWVLLGRFSGELDEYMSNKRYEIYDQDASCPYEWFQNYKKIVRNLLVEQGFCCEKKDC